MLRAFLRREIRAPFAYGAALALTGLAWLLSQSLQPVGSPYVPLLIALVAVLGSAAVGGPGPALLAAAILAACVDYFFVFPAGWFKLPDTTAEIVAFASFLAAAGITGWISLMARRAGRHRSRAEAVSARLATETLRRGALRELAERALVGGSVEAVGRDAVTLAVSALRVEHAAIFEATSERELVVVSTTGWEAGALEGTAISADVDSQAGYALHAREPVVIADADVDTRFALPPEVRERGVRSAVAARIAARSGLLGVVAAYSKSARAYDSHDVEFLGGVAAVLAGVYERRRLEAERADLAARDQAHRAAAALASKRAAFLSQTATVFDTALEPDATLVSLARLAVPALAECAIVDLVHEDGHVRRVEVVEIDPVRREASQTLLRQAPNVRNETPFSRAIRTGQPALLSRVPDRDSGAGPDPEHERLFRLLLCQSLLLIPLVARGQTLGLLTLASRERRYDAVDLALAQDLSGRAAIALDNSRLYREAEAAGRAKDDFLAMVSHELRTPLNAVLGWATILREHQLDESHTKHACAAIERSARAQARFLEQLLDVSRAISGKLELRLVPASIAGVLEAAVDAVRPEAHAKRVPITTRVDQGIPPLMIDPERLQQVVTNVLANAVKFSPNGGMVQVELRRADRFVEIVVVDHGIGIKREFLPYVFERFRQAGAQAGSANRGLGLGMSIARDILDRHGGTITADSAGEGKGATFTVRLPLSVAPELADIGVPAASADSEDGSPTYPMH